MKLSALIIIACAIALLAVFRRRSAVAAVPAALFVSIRLGAGHVSSEPVIVAALLLGTLAGGMVLSRLFATERRLLGLIVAVVVVHLVLFSLQPSWVAVTPLGPTQNARFWGMGNQLETLLLAPLLTGALLAGRRFGRFGFVGFAAVALVLVTDNRFGSDGGGAIVFGRLHGALPPGLVVAFAFLGARALRLGARGFLTLLLLAATFVLALVSYNLAGPGPDHLRSALGQGLSGLLRVAENRVPLAYLPALHDWPLVLPLAIWFGAALVAALRVDRSGASRDLVVAVGLAVGTSLLVNDSAAYELVGGVATLLAVVRFRPTTLPRTVTAFAPLRLSVQPLPSEAARD